jgi:hypothetical protein
MLRLLGFYLTKTMKETENILRPQEGFQQMFLSSEADIVIGGGAAGCFVGTTLVATLDGHKEISKIKLGDYVLSFNVDTKQLQFKKVINTFKYGGVNDRKDMVDIQIYNQTIKTTTNHEFYIEGEWITAKDITKQVLDRSNTEKTKTTKLYHRGIFEARELNVDRVETVSLYKSSEYVYDLCVQDNHNYCVTTDNIIVHNSGKSYALLLELARLINVDNATAVIFRRTRPELLAGGGLWDTAVEIYNPLAEINNTKLELVFPSKCKIKFSHMQLEKDVYAHQGSQYGFLGFDEVQHFSWSQFRYMLSRNRTMADLFPYVRCTCNPEAGIWLRDFIDWWIGGDGFPLEDRDGVLRYMYMNGSKVKDIVWGDTKQEVITKLDGVLEEIALKFGVEADSLIKSVTFIAGSLEDNKKLLQSNPEYISNLLAQDEAEQAKLLYGNWNEFSDDSQRLFSNLDKIFSNSNGLDTNGLYTISVDVARLGKDLAVVKLWKGFEVIGMQIFTRCTTENIYDAVEAYRDVYSIPRNLVVVDSDGVGGGVVDRGRYIGINNGGRPVESINETTNFANLKSQLFYLAARVINNHLVTGFKINTDQIYVDGKRTNKINGELISDKILEELSAFTRDYTMGKKRVNTKDDIKKKIGHSPDLVDSLVYNFYLYLNRPIHGLNRPTK